MGESSEDDRELTPDEIEWFEREEEINRSEAGMDTKKITVRGIDQNGQPIERQATLVVCGHCGGEAFHIYKVNEGGEDHSHIQCTGCGLTFCQGGSNCGVGSDPKGL